MGVHVTDVRRDGMTVTPKAGGASQEYAARTVLWTAGVEAVPFARHVAEVLGAKSDRAGRIAVDADLSVPGHPNVFVVGDLVGRDKLPGVAENAMQGGLHAAACIRHDVAGQARKHYPLPGCRLRCLHQPRPCGASARTRAAGRLPRLVGLGFHPHRLPHWRAKPHQHRRDLAGHDRPRAAHRPDVHARQPHHIRAALHLVGVRSRQVADGSYPGGRSSAVGQRLG